MTTVLAALDDSLETTPRLPRDAVTVALAQRYAGALDDCLDELINGEAAEDPARHARVVLEISRLGARLEATLDRLGMSPGSRPAHREGQPGGDGVDTAGAALDQLRRDASAGAPASGIDYTAAVDPAVTEVDAED